MKPFVRLAVALLAVAATLPALADDDLPALLSNYLAAAQQYHRCRCRMAPWS